MGYLYDDVVMVVEESGGDAEDGGDVEDLGADEDWGERGDEERLTGEEDE